MARTVGEFTGSDVPLRWPAFCEVCRRVVLPPYFFKAPEVSKGKQQRTRYRCGRSECVHAWQQPEREK